MFGAFFFVVLLAYSWIVILLVPVFLVIFFKRRLLNKDIAGSNKMAKYAFWSLGGLLITFLLYYFLVGWRFGF